MGYPIVVGAGGAAASPPNNAGSVVQIQQVFV